MNTYYVKVNHHVIRRTKINKTLHAGTGKTTHAHFAYEAPLPERRARKFISSNQQHKVVGKYNEKVKS